MAKLSLFPGLDIAPVPGPGFLLYLLRRMLRHPLMRPCAETRFLIALRCIPHPVPAPRASAGRRMPARYPNSWYAPLNPEMGPAHAAARSLPFPTYDL
jgi:hypothetical protein